jgi:hypothetical protein
MSLIQVTGRAIVKVTGFILGYFVLAGPYYTILNTMFGVCTDAGGTELLGFIAWSYDVCYYGYPSVVVFGILWTVLSFYMEIRRRYYATDEVSTYGY